MTIKYRDYIYEFEDEIEPRENCKRYHEYYRVIAGMKLYQGAIPLSPYDHMTEGLFQRWIQAGEPTREMMGGHRPEHIDKYWQEMFGETIDKILLGEHSDR